MELSDIIMVVLGVTVAIVVGGYVMVPLVTDVLGVVDNPTWAAMISVAVVITFLTIAIYPLYSLSKHKD